MTPVSKFNATNVEHTIFSSTYFRKRAKYLPLDLRANLRLLNAVRIRLLCFYVNVRIFSKQWAMVSLFWNLMFLIKFWTFSRFICALLVIFEPISSVSTYITFYEHNELMISIPEVCFIHPVRCLSPLLFKLNILSLLLL